MTIHSDLVSTQTLSQSKDGYKVERVFFVTGVVGSKEARLYNALQTSGIPVFGEPHPVVPGIFVSDLRVEPIKDGDQIKISVLYEVPSDDDPAGEESTGVISISSGTLSEAVHKDINGELLSVRYVGVSLTSGTSGITEFEQVKTVDVQRPQISVTLKRKESVLPKQIMQDYIGTVNSVPWSGFPAKTWLATSIVINESKGEFNVEYRFAYKKDTWQVEVAIEVDNVIPLDALDENGFKIYDVYEARNFNDLGLSF